MTLEAVGYGMGQKDFPRANCLRAMLGETAAESGDVVELACNLDDMTGEGIAFAMERLLAAGALDVYTAAIGMKKSRPGVMLCVLCREEQREDIFDLVHLKYRKHVERKKESIYWTYHNGSSATKSGPAEDAEAQGGTA